jgi:hypothetical protein
MSTAGSSEQACQLVRDAMPDLNQRLPRFQVLSGPPDADLQSYFFEFLDDLMPRLHQAGVAHDRVAIARHAHTLKGTGGSVGYPELSALGERLEEVAKAGLDGDARALIAVLAKWLHLARGGAA